MPSLPQNTQAIVRRPSSKPHSALLLFRLGAADEARQFLRDWRAYAPDASEQEPAGPALHFLFGWAGIEALLGGRPGLDPVVGRKEFGGFFSSSDEAPEAGGLRDPLGFSGDSHPSRWWNGDGAIASRDIAFAIHALFDDEVQRSDFLQRLRTSAADHGLEEIRIDAFPEGALTGARPSDGRLHFGFRDGITTPDVDWQDSGAPGKTDLREFVVGYPSEDYLTKPLNPGAWQDFARDGSYVGVTWVQQDVAAFNRFLDSSVGALAGHAPPGHEKDWLAAKMMGRWRDGSPVSLYPGAPPAAPDRADAFGYADDPAGLRCPLTAHIRVANCRDQPMRPANQSRFPKGPPRLIRRGFSYGERLSPEDRLDDDGHDRGIVGLFIFARINEQFYTVLRWMNETSFSELFSETPKGAEAQDAMLGTRTGPKVNTEFLLPVEDMAQAPRLRLAPFLRYRGVAVLFAPSLTGLDLLAQEPA